MTAFSAEESRKLLSRVRDVMAGKGSPQSRLDKTVRLIAQGMKADVCSCYILRAGEVLELFATHGLDPGAVHVTRLRLGEGLVGEIAAHARVLALADAWSHPQFVYRPETGEDFFRSFLGVPLIQAGKLVGVMSAQTREERQFDSWQVETLETIAMVIAELMSSTGLIKREEIFPAEGNTLLPQRLAGLGLNGGVGIGVAVLHRPDVRIGRLVSENAEEEKGRLAVALETLQSGVDDLLSMPGLQKGSVTQDYMDVLEAYRMFAADKGWIRRIEEAIDNGLTAEAAVQRVHAETRVRMTQIANPLIKERLLDMDDLVNRLLSILTGAVPSTEMPEDAILVCRSIGPAELLDYDAKRLRGLVLEEGSRTLHAIVIAKALDIPVIGRVSGALSRIDPMDPLIVDGNAGQVVIRPGDELTDVYSDSIKALAEQKAFYSALRELPAETKDGIQVDLHLKAGLEIDLPALADTGAVGIGLYRTELSFLAQPSLPGLKSQAELYERIMDAASGKPVVFRTLDVGGDKAMRRWNTQQREENPAMGWRALRITLDQPSLLRQQLRAMLMAAAGRPLSVMFPMVATVGEFKAARHILDRELETLTKRGLAVPSTLRVGAMVEVPSLLWQLEALLSAVDFLAVGSNDLFQFAFAADRSNTRLQSRYDPLSPPAFMILKSIMDKAGAAKVDVSVCGEMAAQPLGALALIGLGYRSLSMSAGALGPVKAMIRSVRLSDVSPLVESLCGRTDASVREMLRSFALDHGIEV